MVVADMNCDGRFDNFDIDAFVLALAYQRRYPNCKYLNGDMNGDGLLNDFDIDLFSRQVTDHPDGSTRMTAIHTWGAENRLTKIAPPVGMHVPDGTTRLERISEGPKSPCAILRQR